ncbi:MAG: hypothetical protein QOG89_1616 [Thermomicrobiales bacterium]|jgi:hypothetical protein|nr:hypothetical protein [Thermomicrobiales bacterium]
MYSIAGDEEMGSLADVQTVRLWDNGGGKTASSVHQE